MKEEQEMVKFGAEGGLLAAETARPTSGPGELQIDSAEKEDVLHDRNHR